MTDPITPAAITRLRELLRAASSFRSQSMRTAALGVLRKEAAKALPALLDQLAAQAAEIERLRAAMLSALSATSAKVDADISTELLCLGADEIRICIRRLERELAATVKAKQENDERFMIEHDEAWWRVKELEGLLRNVIAEWRDRSASMPTNGYYNASADLAESEILGRCADEIDAVLSKREGGR